MPVFGLGNKKVLIIGEAPGENEDKKGIPFVGESGQLLKTSLRKLGIDIKRDCWTTNSLICRPPGNEIGDEARIGYCRPNIIKTIQEKSPQVIILLGAVACKSVIGWLWKDEDVGGINRWAGQQIPAQKTNSWVCPTWHPSFVLRSQKDMPLAQKTFDEHLASAFSLKSRPYEWGAIPDYKSQIEIIYEPERVSFILNKMIGKGGTIAIDYETDRLKPDSDDAQIICCSVCWEGKKTIAYPWVGSAIDATKKLLRSDLLKVAANCFSGDTRYLTKEYGVVSLLETVGETVTVLNHEGKWTKAAIRSFGIQKTVQTTFARRNATNTVWATPGHEWILEGEEKRLRTDELKAKRYGPTRGADQIPFVTAPKKIKDEEDYVLGIRHGVVLGDGSSTNRSNLFRVRLCGEKRELLRYFQGCTTTYPLSSEGDPNIYVKSPDINLKSVPSDMISDSYMIGFLRGLLSTDGCVNHQGQISITNGRDVIEWCEKHLPRVGYWFQGKHSCLKYADKEYRGSFKLTKDVWTVYFTRESVSVRDLLRAVHLKKFRAVDLGPFKFSELGETREEEVFCATVPDGHSFTLEGGLVTGNCKFEDRWTRKEFGCGVRNWVWDTMLAAHLMDNRPNISSLKYQAFAYLGQESYDWYLEDERRGKGSNARNRLKEVDMKGLLLYCGMDSLLEFKLFELQREKINGI